MPSACATSNAKISNCCSPDAALSPRDAVTIAVMSDAARPLTRTQAWDARTYDRTFGYVTALGAPLLDWLNAKAGESIIDLGCGTGDLTARIAATGAAVRGVDRDTAMIAEARAKHPALTFEVADAYDLARHAAVDAVFSNAALHWMTRPDDVIRAVGTALRPGGRFVAEFGAGSNVATLIAGLRATLEAIGLPQPALPWYFPTPAEHAARLEAGGFKVRRLEYFERPTPMAEGETAANWWRMFGPSVLAQLPAERIDEILRMTDERLAPALRGNDGTWIADYVRLRFLAVKSL
jgi:trans-aconitate methyltransferase